MFWPFTTKKATDVSQLLKKIMNFGREGYKDRNFSQNGKQKCPLQSMLQPRFSLWLWTSYGVSGNASFEWGKMPLSCVSLESWWGFYVGVVFMVKLWVVRSCEVWSWLSAGHDPWHKPPTPYLLHRENWNKILTIPRFHLFDRPYDSL